MSETVHKSSSADAFEEIMFFNWSADELAYMYIIVMGGEYECWDSFSE